MKPRDVALMLAIFLIALWQHLALLDVTPFNPDESRWLHRAHYLREVWHPSSATWDDGYLTRGQPPLGSYAIGIGLLAQGRDLKTNGSWVFTCQEGICRDHFDEATFNRVHGNVPSSADLDAGRRTNAVIGALTAVAMYALGRRLTTRVGAMATALILAAHPFQAYISSLATADALFGWLLALAALAAARFAARPTWPGAILLGVILGLGGATKLSPLVTAVLPAGLGAVLIGWSWWRRRAWPDRFALGLVAAPLVALLTFVAVYPYLWPDPIDRTIALFTFRAQEMEAQGSDWPSLAVPTRTEAFRQVGFTLGTRWDATRRAGEAGLARLGIDTTLPPLDLPLALIGLEVLVVLAVQRGPRSPTMLVLLLLGGQVAITIAGMRAAFDRYHVPMVLLVALCAGVLVGQVSVGVRQMIDRLVAWRGTAPSPIPSRVRVRWRLVGAR